MDIAHPQNGNFIKMEGDDSMVGHQDALERDMERDRSRSPVRRSRSRSGSNERRGDRKSRWGRDRGDRNDADRKPIVTSRRVYITNIPYEMKWPELKDLFKKEVGDVGYLEILQGHDGKSIGAGIMEFKDMEAAQRACDVMHRFEVSGRKIVVREERESDRRRLQRMKEDQKDRHGGAAGGGGGGGGGGGNRQAGLMGSGNNNMSTGGTTNINSQILQNLNIDGPLTSQVFVANLDYKVTERKLRDIFRMAGTMVLSELKVDKEGKSRGMAIVRYEHPLEAIQAISMFNGYMLFDRPMSIRMDKLSDNSCLPQNVPNKLPTGLKSVGMGLGQGGQPLINVSQLTAQLVLNQFQNNMGGAGNMGNMGGNMGNMGMGNIGGGMGTGMSMGNMGMGNMSGGMGNMGMANMGSGMGGGMGNMGSGMGNMGSGMGSNMVSGMGGGMGNLGSGMGSMGSGMGGGLNDMMGGSSGGMSSIGSSMGNMGNIGTAGMNMGNMGGGLGSMAGGMGDSFSNRMGSANMGNNMGSNRENSSSDETFSIYVRNLPFSYTWQNLKERFRHIGEVKYAAIKMENGKSKGVGMVRFASLDQARNAIANMGGVRIEGHEIEVGMLHRGMKL